MKTVLKLIFTIFFFFTFAFAKGEVSKIFAHKENATASSYSADGDIYKWGEGENIVIDGFEYNGHHYNYVSESPIIKIRRSDNANATGEPCGLFAEKKSVSGVYDSHLLSPTFPQDCDMAKVMGGRIINIGALDLFKNGNDSYDTPKNIERVDFISPNGIVAPSNSSSLAKAGHVVTEKSGNNEIKIAAILSLDTNGDPSSFGPLVTVHDQNGDAQANRKVDYGDTYIYLDDGSTIGWQKLGFYRNEKNPPQTPKPTRTGDSTEKLGMAFVSLEDLGISVGQKYYGFAYFGSDVYDSMNLVDYTSFPKNTPWNALHHTDTADPYGGVASYFVDEDIYKLSISDANITEGDSGTKHLNFTVTLDKPAPNGGVTVQVEPHNITANEGEDYTRYTSSIYFAQGESSKTIYYLINGDTKVEEDETFKVELHNPQNAILGRSEAIGTILNDDNNGNITATCYALTDNSDRLYKVTMSPNANPLPIASYISISKTFNGEGSAYRASDNKFYAFKGVSDDEGPSDLYSIDVETGEIRLEKEEIISDIVGGVFGFGGTDEGTVEGAEFYFDPTLNREILYVISREEDSKLYAFDPDNNWALLSGYPKDTNTDLSSLAINPINGVAYAIDDYNYHGEKPKVYQLNLKTGATTHITTLQNLADAEGLAFASDGNLYIEDEGSYDDNLNGQKLYKVSLQTGELIPSAITNANGDIEGLSCNGTQMAIDNPTVTLDGNSSVLEGDSNTTDLIFSISLSKPAVEDIVLHYEITDINTTANEDYILDSNLSVLIPKDANSSSIVVKVIGDTDIEDNETFSLKLLDATNAIINSSSVIGTIINDDEEEAPELIAEYRFDECPLDLTEEIEDHTPYRHRHRVRNGFTTNGEVLQINRSGEFHREEKQYTEGEDGLDDIFGESSNEFTITTWVYPTSLTNDKTNHNTANTIFAKASDSANDNIEIGINSDGTLHLYLDTKSKDKYADFGEAGDIGTNSWHFIGVSYKDGEVTVQIDDKTYTNNTTWSGATNIDNAVGSPVTIGASLHIDNYFDGYIDEFKIFRNRVTARVMNQFRERERNRRNWDDTEREAVVCEEPQEPFTCNETLYLSNRTELGTGSEDSGATWLHSFYATGATYAPIGDGFISGDGGYNAIGYNVQDNFIYALYSNHLLKVDANAVVKDLGEVQGLPAEQLYAGEFDRDGYYYVSGNGGADNKMYKIDIEQKKVVATITLSQSVRFWDMAIDTSGEYFYAMLIENDKNYKFAKIKISDGTITTIGDSHSDLSSYISLIFSDAEDKIIALAQDGKLYEIMPQSGKVYFTRPFEPLTFYNDGTSCPDANITLPPHPPRLSINNVSQLEGDSGETTFNFTVTADKPFDISPMSGAIFYYRVVDGDGDEVVPPHEVALSSDHDFQSQQGIGMGISMFSDGVSINIPVTVYGDKKIERDEEFYVEIYSPQIPFGMSPEYIIDKNIGIGTIINDDYSFNIERVDSNNSENNQIQKESLYTQITNRDFDYAIVSYNGQDEYNINNTLFKIELLDMNTTDENNVLYTGYYYANEELKSRFPIEDSDDLKIQKATREARFKIYYIPDVNSTKVNEFNTLQDAYENLESNSSFKKGNSYSRDSFAIRPLYYRIELNDLDENNQTVTYATNYNTQTQELKLVAGYPYTLRAYVVKDSNNTIATHYRTVNSKELNVTLDFDETGTTHCADTNTTKIENYNFSNGELNQEISHDNVGKYTLHIEDINWTDIDKDGNNLGCVIGSSSNVVDNTGKFGCNISSDEGNDFRDISMVFQAYEFSLINTAIKNPLGKNYVYMSNLDKDARMGIDIFSNIIAQGYNHNVLTNFTTGCFAKDVNIVLNTDFSDDKNQARYGIQSLNDNNISSNNIVVKPLFEKLNVPATTFLDENEGNCSIKVRYNIGKEYNQTTNPIKVTFESFDANSSYIDESKPKVSDINRIKDINSTSIINNQSQIFYFARVSSYLKKYPATSRTSIRTPLLVEVYCITPTTTQDWCRDTMKLTDNGMILNGQKTYEGWYLATQHNSLHDGTVKSLNSSSSKVATNYTETSHYFINGKIDNIQTLYIANKLDREVKSEIKIYTDDWLRYNRFEDKNASYFVTFQPISGMAGVISDDNKNIGLGYNLMRTKNSEKLNGIDVKNGKISW